MEEIKPISLVEAQEKYRNIVNKRREKLYKTIIPIINSDLETFFKCTLGWVGLCERHDCVGLSFYELSDYLEKQYHPLGWKVGIGSHGGFGGMYISIYPAEQKEKPEKENVSYRENAK